MGCGEGIGRLKCTLDSLRNLQVPSGVRGAKGQGSLTFNLDPPSLLQQTSRPCRFMSCGGTITVKNQSGEQTVFYYFQVTQDLN